MMEQNPFVKMNDDGYDVLMAEKYYVLTNIYKKWGMDDKFDGVIEKVIFRGEKPWNRMDIEVRNFLSASKSI